MGLQDGVCGGIGGSQHLQRDNFYSNGILGGMAPVAAGMAMAEKTRDTGAIVTVFHGDGAMSEGTIHETLNIASLWKLPLLFAIESNKYAQSTPIDLELSGSIAHRAAAFDIPATEVDGNDVLMVHEAASQVISAIRAGDGPQMLVLDTYRLGPHSKGDMIAIRSRLKVIARRVR
jgi:TPP-dependent pyruvate/acetoin dehydrogenase alpha subunit